MSAPRTDADIPCDACGATHADRLAYRDRHGDDGIPVDLKDCPYCSGHKCCLCDMGDDVSCLGCEDLEDD